jgi:hypothetical protein
MGNQKPFRRIEGSEEMENAMTKEASVKKTLPAAARKALTDYVKTQGKAKAAEVLDVSEPTLARAIAGFELQRGSVALIEAGLAKLQQGGAK